METIYEVLQLFLGQLTHSWLGMASASCKMKIRFGVQRSAIIVLCWKSNFPARGTLYGVCCQTKQLISEEVDLI